MRTLIIQHDHDGYPGALLEPIERAGSVQRWDTFTHPERPDLDGIDAIVSLGGTAHPDQDHAEPWLAAEWQMIAPHVRVVVALGGFAWQAAVRLLGKPSTSTKFGHGAVGEFPGATLLGCYHPSQQNMFTGRLTPEMLTAVLTEAASLAGVPPRA